MKWEFIVKRKLSILFLDLISNGQKTADLKRLFNINNGYNNYLILDNEAYYSQNEVEERTTLTKKLYKTEGPSFFKRFLKVWFNFFDELEKTADKISKKDVKAMTKEEIIEELEKYKYAQTNASSALMFPLLIENLADDILKSKLLHINPAKAEEYFMILASPNKENESTKEMKSILNIALKMKQNKDYTEDLKNHINKFSWINTRGFYGKPWDEEDILERANLIIKEGYPEETLIHLNSSINKTKEQTKAILKDIEADKELEEFVDITKQLVHFRTYRMDMYVKQGLKIVPLFDEIAERIGIYHEDIFYLTYDEIIDSLKNNTKYNDQIKERKKRFGFYRKEGRLKIYTGDELEELTRKNIKKEINESITELKGTTACKGKLQGKVKIIPSKDHLDKVKKGDILITSMTTPDFIPAMERAAAFVTDEGGILCHAAIVSREMNKPCIIGTNIATKIFKDGELVEVDAHEGIIKKIQ